MIKSILTIFCFLGLSFSQIQYGGIPEYYETRDEAINFYQVDPSETVDRDFHPMVFQFGHEYDVDINFMELATVIDNGSELTFYLGIESYSAYALGLNFSEFYLTENSKLFF